MNDLTTLAAVKTWTGVQNSASDALLSSLITAWSRAILTYLSIPSLVSREYSERYDGVGNCRILLRVFPVTAVKSLKINGIIVPASTDEQNPSGYLLDPWNGLPPGAMQALDVFGHYFHRGRQNISIAYQAGYRIDGEAQTIPIAPYQLSAISPYGPWAQDEGVTFADGTPLANVPSGPVAGQYAVDTNGKYTFAASDSGQVVLISYSFIPADIAQCATALVAEDYSYKGRIGEVSKSLGGQESVAYSQADIPARYKTVLNQYRAVVPV